MYKSLRNRLFVGASVLAASFLPVLATADEVWVAPTLQADFGGLGTSVGTFWPVTPVGAVRFALGVPEDLQTFEKATIALIPTVSGASTLSVFVCDAQDSESILANCTGPVNVPFNGVTDELREIDISTAIALHVGVPGATNLAVLAYSTSSTLTDRIVGMRFRYKGLASPTGTQTVNVDCASQNIQDALDNAAPGGELRIVVTGTCTENIEIRRSRVTLAADGVGDGIKAATTSEDLVAVIHVSGAQNVLIDGLTIDGDSGGTDPDFGVLVDDGSAVFFDNGAVIKNASDTGLVIVDNGQSDFFNSTIQDSGGDNISVSQSSSLDLNGATLLNSGGAGVNATLGASVRLINSMVTGNPRFGILLTNGAIGRLNAGNTIESSAATEATGAAIYITRNSSLEIRGGGNVITNTVATVADPSYSSAGGMAVSMWHLSLLRQDSGDATFNGNLAGGTLSLLQLRSGTTVNGNLYTSGGARNDYRGTASLGSTINGNVYPNNDGGWTSLRTDGTLTINGNVDCTNGTFVTNNFTNFGGGGGYVNGC